MDQSKRRTYAEAKRVVEKELLPVWGDLGRSRPYRARAGHYRCDCRTWLGTMSRRVHATIHRFFAWCVARTVLGVNPAAGLAKHGNEVKRDRVLSDAEIKALWELAVTYPFPFAPAVRMMLLTGQRQAKVSGIRWSDIGDFWSDIDGIVWTIRREAREKGTPEKLILPQLALDVLDACPKVEGQDLIFSTNGKTPVSGWSKVKKLFDEQLNFDEPWRWHDLRRTAATGMNELGAEPHIVSHC